MSQYGYSGFGSMKRRLISCFYSWSYTYMIQGCAATALVYYWHYRSWHMYYAVHVIAGWRATPHYIISSQIFCKTVLAMKYVLIQDPASKERKFLTLEGEICAMMLWFRSKLRLPLTVQLIVVLSRWWSHPMTKPAVIETLTCVAKNSSLLLSIVDVNGLFL